MILLLLTLSACGTMQDGVDRTSEAKNYYRAVHTIPRNTAGIKYASFSDNSLYYITNQQRPDNKSVIPTRLAEVNIETQEELRYEGYFVALEEFADTQKAVCEGIMALTVGRDDIMSAVVQLNPRGEPVHCRLISMMADGTVQWNVRLSDEYILYEIQNLIRDDQGNTYLLVANGDFYIVNEKGRRIFTSTDGYHHMTRLSDGRVVLFQQNVDTWKVLLPDLEKGGNGFQTLCTFPRLQEGDPRNGGFYAGNSEYDLFCATDLSLYGVKLGTEDKPGTATQILSWINCDVDGTGILDFTVVDDNSFAIITHSADLGADLAFLEWQETDPYAEKNTLTIACRQLPEALSRAIQKFNRQSADCRSVVRDYTTASAEGVDRLTADLNAGNMPDLFCMEGVDEQTLVNRGYLEDLWPYIDADDQLGRDALVEPLFDAMSIGGKLYTVTRGFTLKTTLGLKALVGEKPGWSFAEFAQLVKNTPELESYGNIYFDRAYALDVFLELYMGNYIDWSEGTATFDSPEFIEAMEYLMLYPEKINHQRGDRANVWLTEGKQLFTCNELDSVNFYDFDMIYSVSRKENAVWKGYPGLPGNGAAFQPQLQLAMASTGKNKEAAWSFLRTVLLPENQDFDRPDETATVHSMPTNKAVFDAMVQTYVDQWYTTGVDFTSSAVNPYGEDVKIDRWTQEDIDAFYALIEGTTVVVRPQEMIAGILRDEITRFFAGQQDAQTAAKAIQNRVQLCLDEQS